MADPQAIVRDWLKALGALVSSSVSFEEAASRLDVFVPFISRDVPVEAFTAASLHAIAQQCKFWPSYCELSGMLRRWWADNNPNRAPRIAPPIPPQFRVDIPKRREPPSEDEVGQVRRAIEELQADLARQAIEREEGTCKRPNRPPAELSAGQLLASHEQAGPISEVRAAALRKKIQDERQAPQVTGIPLKAVE